MSQHECKCGPRNISIHGNCNRCGGRAPATEHGKGREQRARGWTGAKARDFYNRAEHGTVIKKR